MDVTATSPIGPRPEPSETALLEVDGLTVDFARRGGRRRVVDGASFDIRAGEVLGMVGESGSGKSMTAMSILRLHSRTSGAEVGGSVRFEGTDLASLSNRQMRRVRGKSISMIFQDPMTSLNPVHTIGQQLQEAVRVHRRRMPQGQVRARCLELLALVGMPDPERRLRQYPFEFSGGMRQRVMIAMALANSPQLLIADEPTTALDVTIQAQVLRVLDQARVEENAAALLITHDLGVLAELADRMVVMYAGRVMEFGDVDSVFHKPKHPYTAALMASMPSRAGRSRRVTPIPGVPPDPSKPTDGCPFEPRCFLGNGRERCRTQVPPLIGDPAHPSACHFADEMPEAARAAGLMRTAAEKDDSDERR